MSEASTRKANRDASLAEERPKSLAISECGVSTGQDFVNLMSSLMSDLIAGRIQPTIANAVCNAGGKMLKVVEMQHKFGKPLDGQLKVLMLAEPAKEAE
jgi:hypothetical protein